MIPFNDVGIVSNLPLAEVKAWMQAEDLHYTLAANGSPLVCLNSMLKRLRKPTIEARQPDGNRKQEET